MLTAGGQGPGGHPLCRSQWGWGRRSPSTGMGGGSSGFCRHPQAGPSKGSCAVRAISQAPAMVISSSPVLLECGERAGGRGVGGSSGGLPSRKLCGLEEPESHRMLCIHPRIVPTLLAQSTHLRSGRMRFQSYSCWVPSGCCGQVT